MGAELDAERWEQYPRRRGPARFQGAGTAQRPKERAGAQHPLAAEVAILAGATPDSVPPAWFRWGTVR
jgi:hypothetical protein